MLHALWLGLRSPGGRTAPGSRRRPSVRRRLEVEGLEVRALPSGGPLAAAGLHGPAIAGADAGHGGPNDVSLNSPSGKGYPLPPASGPALRGTLDAPPAPVMSLFPFNPGSGVSVTPAPSGAPVSASVAASLPAGDAFTPTAQKVSVQSASPDQPGPTLVTVPLAGGLPQSASRSGPDVSLSGPARPAALTGASRLEKPSAGLDDLSVTEPTGSFLRTERQAVAGASVGMGPQQGARDLGLGGAEWSARDEAESLKDSRADEPGDRLGRVSSRLDGETLAALVSVLPGALALTPGLLAGLVFQSWDRSEPVAKPGSREKPRRAPNGERIV
jgi:hypothetical protein